MSSCSYRVLETKLKKVEEASDGSITYKFDPKQHAELLLGNLNFMQASKNKDKPFLTDIEVYGSDEIGIPFHSVVLAACSTALEETLTSDHFKKYGNGEFVIHDVTSAGIAILRDIAYGCNVTMTADNLEDIRKLATSCGINELENACERYEEEIEEENSTNEARIHLKDKASPILEAIADIWQEDLLTDIMLQDEDQETELSCHKSCLAAASSTFRNMLEPRLPQRRNKIAIKDLRPNALGGLIGYIYTAEVTIDSDNVEQLITNASHFQLPDIVNAACDWLERALTCENAIGILELVQNVENDLECVDGLEQTVFKFIVDNFSDIVETSDEFLAMSLDNLSKVMMDDDLGIHSEEELFHAVMKWVKHEEKTRLQCLPELLHLVRLEYTTHDFLTSIEQDLVVQKVPECFDTIQEARNSLDSVQGYENGSSEDNYSSSDVPSCYDDTQSPASARTSSLTEEQLHEEDEYSSEGFYHEEEDRSRVSCNTGRPDMRLKENRDKFLPHGTNKDGTPDKRCNRKDDGKKAAARKLIFSANEAPRRKNGQLDMRFKVNRERFLGKALNKDGGLDKRTSKYTDCLPKRKDGRPDMRFKVNKDRLKPAQQHSKPMKNPPLTKSGKPDMRFSVNKRSVSVTHYSQEPSPVKKDGTPDMRFKINKARASSYTSSASPPSSQLSRSSKRDGTQDTRFLPNKSTLGGSYSTLSSQAPSLSSYSSVPLKRDGTPDMRYSANKSTLGSSYSALSSHAPSLSSYSSGPLKKDGTLDMRYSANKSLYGSSSSSSSRYVGSCGSSSGWRTSSSSSLGPLKRDGTLDMRFKANRR